MTRTRRQFIKATSAAGGTIGVEASSELHAAQSRSATLPTDRAKALMAMFGLRYPIFEAPHGLWATGPELAIAVSNAGAMGAMALTAIAPARVRNAVSQVRAATKGSFVINYILAVSPEPSSLSTALDAGAPVVQFSWGIPDKKVVSIVRVRM